MSEPHLVLYEVMLFGSGSRNLHRVGSGARELEYYRRIKAHFSVWIFEYEDPDESWTRAGLNSVRRSFQSRFLHSTIGALLAGRSKPAPTVIRTKQFWGAWAGTLLSMVTGRPLIIRMGYHWSYNFILERGITSPVLQWMIRAFERLLLRSADGLVFGSSQLAQAFPQIRAPWIVAPNGIDTALFYPDGRTEEYDLIYVGRLLPIKGFDRLVRILPEGRRICIIGAGPLEKLLGAMPGLQRIERLTNEELPRYLRAARCFVSMSLTEGSPKALLEAICCGCYPILSDIGPHRSLVTELGYGTLLAADVTAETLSRAVDQARIDVMKLTAFRTKYSMDGLVQQEVDFMKRIGTHV